MLFQSLVDLFPAVDAGGDEVRHQSNQCNNDNNDSDHEYPLQTRVGRVGVGIERSFADSLGRIREQLLQIDHVLLRNDCGLNDLHNVADRQIDKNVLVDGACLSGQQMTLHVHGDVVVEVERCDDGVDDLQRQGTGNGIGQFGGDLLVGFVVGGGCQEPLDVGGSV